ncbi:hypothetical protein F4859DRAFT_517033 [Xylaria cf. heliscus]|nr:hypothetical protein F4859DRAFT_517033 [Xylaria cf. heliscus]
MTERKDTPMPTPRKVSFGCVFFPVKDNPAEAKKFIRGIFKNQPDNVELIAAELAPLYGFGPESNKDPLARSRAEAVFTSPQVKEPVQEFLQSFVGDQWGLPLADWDATLELVHKHRSGAQWPALYLIVPEGASAEQHYARFIIRMLDELVNPLSTGQHMLLWLGDGVRAGKDDDVSWVLFHALMCFQIKSMELNKSHAPKKVLVAHYFQKFFKNFSKVIPTRGGLGDVATDN